MADIDRPVGIVNQRRSRSGSYSKALDAGRVSSDVAEAMDRIFPKSPSKFLQNPFPTGHGIRLPVGHKKSSQVITSSCSSIFNVNQTLSCTVSNAHITTDTTTTATAIFTGLSTSASGTKSPIMSSVPAYYNDIPSLPASAIGENSVAEQNGVVACKPKPLSKSRGSRADLEICSQNIVDSPRSGAVEKVCSESSKTCPELDQIQMLDGKKTKKKHKKYVQSQREASDFDKRKSSDDSKMPSNIFVQENYVHDILSGEQVASSVNSDTLISAANGHNYFPNHSGIDTLTNGEVDNVCEENIVYPPSIKVRQKLPKVKRRFVNVTKDCKYLRKKFLPCFVVLKKLDCFLSEGSSTVRKFNFNMDLSERVSYLSAMCEKNAIECSKSKRVVRDYKNIFEESLLEHNSEDEFVNPRGRSLRKRNHNVCYVEPSEDDLVDDFSSKRSNKKKSLCPDDSRPEACVKEIDKNIVESQQSPVLNQEKTAVAIVKEQDVRKITPILDVPNEKHIKQKTSDRDSKERLKEKTPDKDSKERFDKKKSPTKTNHKTKTSIEGSSTENNQKGRPTTASQERVEHLKDPQGRSLVYVYPKSSVVKAGKTSGKNDSEKSVKTKRPGPASKTQQPFNLSTSLAPVTTLSLPRSLLGISGNIVARGVSNMTTLSQQTPPVIQPPISGSATSPQFYMVKIDGKDFLVPILAGSSQQRPTTPSAVTLPSNALQPGGACRLIYQPVPGLPNPQMVQARASGPNPTQQPFAMTRFSTVMLPGTPISSGVHMVPPSLNTNNILSTVPLLGSSRIATTCIPATCPSQASLTGRQSQLIPSSVMTTAAISLPHGSTSLVSLVGTSSASAINLSTSASQSIMMTSTASRTLLTSTVAPLAAPASTTVLRSSRPRAVVPAVTSATPVVSNSTATAPRCFRIIVPGCTATGTPARIATLGTPANSSPLTHMTLSSSLLPQRKRSIDKEMSPEKHAAKRRRLEKKYPLPPGVVIKTEPQSNPQPATTTVQAGSVRSLLGQNIQLITTAPRGSTGTVQNIRIIAPSIGSRQMRLSSNVIIRAPNVSAVNVTTGSIPAVPALAVSGSGLVIVAPSTQSSTSTVNSSSSKAVNSLSGTCSTVTTRVSTRAISTVTSSSSATTATVSTVTSSSPATTTTITTASTPDVTSKLATSVSGLHSNLSTSTGTASDKITTLSYSISSTTCTTLSTASPASSSNIVSSQDKTSTVSSSTNASGTTNQPNSLESLEKNIKSLRKIICGQERLGLQGQRLQKLKELLAQKESALAELQKDVSNDRAIVESSGARGEEAQVPPASTASGADVIVID